jgi:hypothetical protein
MPRNKWSKVIGRAVTIHSRTVWHFQRNISQWQRNVKSSLKSRWVQRCRGKRRRIEKCTLKRPPCSPYRWMFLFVYLVATCDVVHRFSTKITITVISLEATPSPCVWHCRLSNNYLSKGSRTDNDAFRFMAQKWGTVYFFVKQKTLLLWEPVNISTNSSVKVGGDWNKHEP